MKVKDLIKELSKVDPESQVYVSRDLEGNGFSPVYQIDYPASMHHGELYCDEDLEEYPEDDPIHEEIEKVVIIWP